MSYWTKTKLTDGYGFSAEFTPMDEMRAVTPYRIVGSSFSDNTTIDTNFWTETPLSAGTATLARGEITLDTKAAAANGSVVVTSVRTARYIGSSSNRFRSQVRFGDTGTTNNTRRFGAGTATNGAFFELRGATLYAVTWSNTDSPKDTAVASTSWNADTTVPTLTNYNTFEIYYTNKSVYFIINGTLKHTVTSTTTPWTDVINLPIRLESTNSASLNQSKQLIVRSATITRLGSAMTLPTWNYTSGTTAGKILKNGQGNLHRMTVGTPVSGSVVTLYDGITTGGAVIFSYTWTAGAQSNNQPFSLDFGGLPFFTGLLLVIATQNSNVLVTYE